MLTGRMGEPAEWLNDYLFFETLKSYRLPWDAHPAFQLMAMINRAVDEHGIFAIKAIDQYFFRLCDRLRHEQHAGSGVPDWDLLAPYFPNPYFLLWTRRSKLRQAISFEKAQQGGAWHSNAEPAARDSQSLLYDGFYLEWIRSGIEQAESRWRKFFAAANLPFLELSDEELLADYGGTVRRVGTYLDLDVDALIIAQSLNPREPVNDRINDFWEELYLEQAKEGLPADFNDTSDHWSNLTHRLWVEVKDEPRSASPEEAVYLAVSVRNLRAEPFELRNSKGPAKLAAIRAQWVDKRNGLRRVTASDVPLPVVWEPNQAHEIEFSINAPEMAKDHRLYLLLIVKDESWVRMNGINSPEIAIDLLAT